MQHDPLDRDDAVVALLRQAVSRDASPHLRYQLSEALWVAGALDEAAQVFRQAFLADPDASPFPPALGSDPVRVRDWTQSLLDSGATFSPVIAARAIAAVLTGDVAGARRLVDYDRFCRRVTVWPPPAFEDLDFDVALANEIKSDLRFYGDHEHPDLATRMSWRNNNVLSARSPACLALAELVREEVERYIASLPRDSSHPFVRSRPSTFVLEAWAVVSRGAGYLAAHLHPRSWLGAVYYVTQPPVSESADSRQGWLRLGLADDYGQGARSGWDERFVEPKRATLFIMPSYFLHGTNPVEADEERISVAFDVVPAEFAVASPRGRRH